MKETRDGGTGRQGDRQEDGRQAERKRTVRQGDGRQGHMETCDMEGHGKLRSELVDHFFIRHTLYRIKYEIYELVENNT